MWLGAGRPELALLGLLVLALGVGLLALPTHALLPAYAGLFAVLLGTALLVPWTTERLALARRRAARGAPSGCWGAWPRGA